MGKLYYKVVRVEEGRAVSVFAAGRLRVEYLPGEWVTPPIGKLFAFDRHENALHYSETVAGVYYDDLIIVRCEVKNPEAQRTNMPGVSYLKAATASSRSALGKFWRAYMKGDEVKLDTLTMAKVWDGSILVDAIKCLAEDLNEGGYSPPETNPEV